MSPSPLFEPLKLREVTLRNRIVVSPMCQYSADNGHANNWQLVHLGSRAVGGAGAVFTEATAVSAAGRISPGCTGIWLDSHVEAWAPCARFIREQGAAAGIQLAHAGRKASTQIPWLGTHALTPEQGGWRPIFAPSAVAFDERSPTPEAMSEAQIDQLILDYKSAASRSLAAGFDVVEVHAAHGYLLHEFLSPLSNQRTDSYGGSFENRIRLLKRVIASVREVWPERLPLWLRISASDWTPGGWDLDQSCALATALVGSGVDLIDVSSGGLIPGVAIPMGSGYQTPFAAEIRRQSGLMTGAVGLITGAEQADHIVRTGQADVVLLAREMLRDPYFPRRAARALGATIAPPKQYGRAW